MCIMYSGIHISQGSVMTCFRCDGMFNDYFVANFPESVPLKKFRKSLNIWRAYDKKSLVYFLRGYCFQCVLAIAILSVCLFDCLSRGGSGKNSLS